MTQAVKHGALQGVRVADLSFGMVGPIATRILAAMGAEVIKVESVGRPAAKTALSRILDGNKLSCTVDMSRPEGQQLVRQLVAESDIVIENFSVRALQKLGLSYEELKAVRPDLIFVSASGFGRTGPERDALAYGSLLQAYSGRVGLMGPVESGLEAMSSGPAWTDTVAALWECLGVLAALFDRRRTGAGAYIDLSMFESTIALLPEGLLRQGLGQSTDEPVGGNREPGAAPAGCFRCAGDDEWLAVSVGTEEQWIDFCEVIGRDDLSRNSAYSDAVLREAGKPELDDLAASWLRGRDAREAEAELLAAGIPAARSRNFTDLVDDPHLAERKLYPVVGGHRTIALPWIDDGWRGAVGPAPSLGADNDYVFGTLLGLDTETRDRLAASGVIQ